MKIIFIHLLLIGHCSFSQTIIRGITSIETDRFIGDSINRSPNVEFNKKIKLNQIDKSKSVFEIRLYINYSLSNTNALYRIYTDGKAWRAIKYDEWNNPIKILKYKLSSNLSFDSLILKLLSYNILSLPNQADLKDKMVKYVTDSTDGTISKRVMRTNDGEGYTIEINFKEKFRVYEFNNPETYSKFYTDVPELKDYLNIIQAFNKYLFTETNSR